MLMSVAQNSVFDLRTYVCTLYVKMAISLPTVCSVGMPSNKGSKHGEETDLKAIADGTLRKKKEQTESIGTYVLGTVKQG